MAHLGAACALPCDAGQGLPRLASPMPRPRLRTGSACGMPVSPYIQEQLVASHFFHEVDVAKARAESPMSVVVSPRRRRRSAAAARTPDPPTHSPRLPGQVPMESPVAARFSRSSSRDHAPRSDSIRIPRLRTPLAGQSLNGRSAVASPYVGAHLPAGCCAPAEASPGLGQAPPMAGGFCGVVGAMGAMGAAMPQMMYVPAPHVAMVPYGYVPAPAPVAVPQPMPPRAGGRRGRRTPSPQLFAAGAAWRWRDAAAAREAPDGGWGTERPLEARLPGPPRGALGGALGARGAGAAPRAAPRPPGFLARGGTKAAGLDAGWTTVMLQNLPADFMRDALVQLLDSQGFAGKYDFAYVPVKFENLRSLGHAFVNFVGPEETARAWGCFDGFADWGMPSANVCCVAWNDKHQGLNALVNRYRDSPVMHELIPDVCKPILMSSDGQRIPFPLPLCHIKPPKEVRMCLQ